MYIISKYGSQTSAPGMKNRMPVPYTPNTVSLASLTKARDDQLAVQLLFKDNSDDEEEKTHFSSQKWMMVLKLAG